MPAPRTLQEKREERRRGEVRARSGEGPVDKLPKKRSRKKMKMEIDPEETRLETVGEEVRNWYGENGWNGGEGGGRVSGRGGGVDGMGRNGMDGIERRLSF